MLSNFFVSVSPSYCYVHVCGCVKVFLLCGLITTVVCVHTFGASVVNFCVQIVVCRCLMFYVLHIFEYFYVFHAAVASSLVQIWQHLRAAIRSCFVARLIRVTAIKLV